MIPTKIFKVKDSSAYVEVKDEEGVPVAQTVMFDGMSVLLNRIPDMKDALGKAADYILRYKTGRIQE